jgi:hypothetical protein
MIQDSDGKGFFVGGRYYLNESIPDFQSKTKRLHEEINENLDFNLFLLPDLLQNNDVMDENLHSIYKEAYCCVACGLYDAGIIKMGQLLEITLKQIIFIETNSLSNKSTFGRALRDAWIKGIIAYQDFQFLFWFLNEYRNPYAHRNFREILKDTKTPILKMPTQFPGKEFNVPDATKILKKSIDGLKDGSYEYELIDSASDPTLACIAKERLDKQRAIILLWAVTIHFEQLVNIYLNQKCYAKHIEKYGSPFEKLTSIIINEDE